MFLGSAVFTVAAEFVSDHYGAPTMRLGNVFNFLATEAGCAAGIEFIASFVLRFGVVLL